MAVIAGYESSNATTRVVLEGGNNNRLESLKKAGGQPGDTVS